MDRTRTEDDFERCVRRAQELKRTLPSLYNEYGRHAAKQLAGRVKVRNVEYGGEGSYEEVPVWYVACKYLTVDGHWLNTEQDEPEPGGAIGCSRIWGLSASLDHRNFGFVAPFELDFGALMYPSGSSVASNLGPLITPLVGEPFVLEQSVLARTRRMSLGDWIQIEVEKLM